MAVPVITVAAQTMLSAKTVVCPAAALLSSSKASLLLAAVGCARPAVYAQVSHAVVGEDAVPDLWQLSCQIACPTGRRFDLT